VPDAPTIHDLRLMTSPEVRAALPYVGCLLVPVGSCEQLGPDLALGSDAAQAEAYARLIAERGLKILCGFLKDFIALPSPRA
jgi:creatinine amidohydrolase/Fe(II)-dependent formamide hydrolase-like protein